MPNNKKRTKHTLPKDTDSRQTCEIIDYLYNKNAKKPPLVVGIRKKLDSE